MANIKSSIKRAQLANVRTLKNAAQKSTLRTSIKRFEEALKGADVEKATSAFKIASRRLDKAATKGIIHRNAAARKKSQLNRQLNNITKVS